LTILDGGAHAAGVPTSQERMVPARGKSRTSTRGGRVGLCNRLLAIVVDGPRMPYVLLEVARR
jgi:hypothetical protein